MAYFMFDYERMSNAEKRDFHYAASITLEAHNNWDACPAPCSIEEAEDSGKYNFHLVISDRPERRNFLVAADLAEALTTLSVLKHCNPDASLWLECVEGRAEIVGPDMCRGVVKARASLDDPQGDDQDWTELAAAIEWCDQQGIALLLKPDDKDIFLAIEGYLGDQRKERERRENPQAGMETATTIEIPIDITPPPDDDYLVCLNRRRQRVKIGDRPGIDMNPDDFVAWCRREGIKLRTACPMLYDPEFPNPTARSAFRRRWMQG